MRLTIFSYRFAREILQSKQFRRQKDEILEIMKRIEVPDLSPPKTRKRGGKEMVFTTDQKTLNERFKQMFVARGWQVDPPVTEDRVTAIKADYKKDRIQVEVQFGNMARWYSDVFKLQVSYSLGLIDLGVLVVPMQEFAGTIDENVAYFERVVRELPYAKMSITLPILVMGVRP